MAKRERFILLSLCAPASESEVRDHCCRSRITSSSGSRAGSDGGSGIVGSQDPETCVSKKKKKDLFGYTKDKNIQGAEQDALKAEIQRVKEEEEQMMREAFDLAPKLATRPKGTRIDKHEFSELGSVGLHLKMCVRAMLK